MSDKCKEQKETTRTAEKSGGTWEPSKQPFHTFSKEQFAPNNRRRLETM